MTGSVCRKKQVESRAMHEGGGRAGRSTGGGGWKPAAPYQPNRVRKKEGANVRKKRRVSNSPHHGEKLLRAYGGCLGAKCRRRTWDTAKSLG
jgi:hypothetical protein